MLSGIFKKIDRTVKVSRAQTEGQPFLGKSADLIIIDDVLVENEYDSDTQKKWFDPY